MWATILTKKEKKEGGSHEENHANFVDHCVGLRSHVWSIYDQQRRQSYP